VRAPFAGVVGQRYVSLGDYVTNSTKLASLHTVNPQRATFQCPNGSRVSCGGSAGVVPRRRHRRGDFTGEVDFVDPWWQLPGRTSS